MFIIWAPEITRTLLVREAPTTNNRPILNFVRHHKISNQFVSENCCFVFERRQRRRQRCRHRRHLLLLLAKLWQFEKSIHRKSRDPGTIAKMFSSNQVFYICLLSLCCCCCAGDDKTAAAAATTSTEATTIRCTEKELEQFSQEYEQCHSRALSQLQAEIPNIESLKETWVLPSVQFTTKKNRYID